MKKHTFAAIALAFLTGLVVGGLLVSINLL